jgi:pimeloyl-ACP methyl ester carboxylesterase
VTTRSATEPKKDNVLRLRDGRMLGYAEYGDSTGTPVFSFHGFPGSRVESRFARDAALQRGIRVIAPDRPGLGLSTYQPRRTILGWPDDVVELADALGIERFAVMGVSGGGPYAAVCAHKIPQRLTGVAIVSGVGPLHRLGATEGMLRTNRIMFGAQRRFPPLGRAIIWLAGIVLKRYGTKGMDRMARALPEADQRIMARPDVRDLFAEDASEAFRSGARGPALENSLFTRPWGFRLEDIAMPVHLWQGGDDRNVPVAHGRYQASALPNCTEHFYAGEGHLLVFERIDEILDAIT